jgi:Tol biopolymer transport system component/predicted Ser/Thr protein kinase
MNSARWKKVDRLLQAALERPPGQRAEFLRQACAGDTELEREVQSLLASQQQEAGSFLESPAMEVAARAMVLKPEDSTSLAGQTISHYRIIQKLGEGGMGVVWKARDTRLDRFVALKVLPADKVSDPERKRRFEQEAKAASALNHPNIITIYDIGQADGIDFMAMEFVPGRALDQLIPRKGLRLSEALKYAIQVADALAAAHAAGIVHRDLKPGNVMVNENGLVKVLDFGLAKLTEQGGAGEFASTETIAEGPKTEEGKIVGTVSYMSPEQAEGKKVDARSDVFSFGSLLYEMLTGRRAFRGDSKNSTLTAILNREPEPAEQVAPGIPREVGRILQRCLRKDLERRAHSIADLKLALMEVKEESESGALAGTGAPAQVKRWKSPLAAVLVLLAAVGGAAWWLFRDNRTPQAALQAVPLTTYPGNETRPNFSPDGNQVTFSWNGEKQDNYDIYVKFIGSGRPLRLTTDPALDTAPSWSPDGGAIAFVRRDRGKAKLMLVPALGGPERELAELQDPATFSAPPSVNWSPDGRWLLVTGRDSAEKPSALWLVSFESGEKRQLTIPPASSDGDYYGAFSPDARTVAFARYTNPAASDLYALPLAANLSAKSEPRRLTNDNRIIQGIAWTADGRELVFSSNRGGTQSLWRVPIAASQEARRLTIGENGSFPSISRQGNRMVYSQSISDSNIWRVNPSDLREPPSELIASTRTDINPQYSPDGKRIAFESSRSGNREVWVCDADGSNAVQLVAMGFTGSPRWSPDSQRIVFDSNGDGNWQIYLVSAHGGRPQRMTKSAANDARPSWSHDGNWIYFGSNRSGGTQPWQVWKIPVGGGEAVQVTRHGGYNAFESKDGKMIYYTKSQSNLSPLWKVPAEGGEENPVIDSVTLHAFTVTRGGIYFIAQPRLQYFNLSTGISKTILTIAKPITEGLTVSPDEQWLLYAQIDQTGSDLMRVEKFR